jgi:hypothetical protein
VLGWLPPHPPPFPEFSGQCHHVDWGGLLHLTTRHEAADVLKMIGLVLNAKYRCSRPRPTDLYWSPGESCCARFSLDDRCYRAVVLEVEVKGDGVLARVRLFRDPIQPSARMVGSETPYLLVVEIMPLQRQCHFRDGVC